MTDKEATEILMPHVEHLSFWQIFMIQWWDMFYTHKFLLLVLRVKQGMHIRFAYEDAKVLKRNELQLLYCNHCEEDTYQLVRETGHERDSSNDTYSCFKCHRTKHGLSGEYEE